MKPTEAATTSIELLDVPAVYATTLRDDPPAVPARVDTRPEIRLLLACARSELDPRTAALVRSLAREQIDWAFAMRKAHQHCVLPLLCSNLTAVASDLLPPDVDEFLQDRLRAHAANNLLVTAELLRVLRLLEDEGIPALPFKGPVLAVCAYGNLSLRQFGDLDVLVHPGDVPRAVDLLASHGYEQDAPEVGASGSMQKDVGFTSRDRRTRIELHWRLSRAYFSFSLDEKRNAREMWEHLETVELAGRRVRTLPVVDLLLYLCSHGSKHRWERLEWISDVAELVRANPRLDWPQVLRRARVLGCARVLSLGLLLAHRLLEAPLPADVVRTISADERHMKLAFDLTCEQLFDDPQSFSHSLAKHQFRHVLKERWRDRVRLGLTYSRVYLRTIFRPNVRDQTLIPLPPYLSFLHYVARPVRLCVTYSAVALKSLRRRGGS